MSKFTAEFTNQCADRPENCAKHDQFKECYYYNKDLYPYLNDFLRTFPLMTFYFNGNIPYYWYPQDYMVQPLDSNVHYCVGVKSLNHVILGALFMRNYDIYFERTAKAIGFRRANCGSDPFFIDDFAKHSRDEYVARTPVSGDTPVRQPTIEEMTIAPNTPVNMLTSLTGDTTGETASSRTWMYPVAVASLASFLAVLVILRCIWRYQRKLKDVEADVKMTIQLAEMNVSDTEQPSDE